MSRLYTASWSALYAHRDALEELNVRPVSASLSYPRFWPASVLFPAIEELAPRGVFGRYPEGPEFGSA
jgi:hypothetical protein